MRLIGLAVVLVVTLGLAPLAAEAQEAGRIWRIGLLDYGSPDPARLAWWRAFQDRLRELGYVEGQNVVFQPRWGNGQVSLPSAGGSKEYAVAGGLFSYGADYPDLFRRAAVFVDKILKGAKPGDLPVEQPTTFELIINLKTAKTFSGSCQATFL
jgi:ABC transporter substrate binding protein